MTPPGSDSFRSQLVPILLVMGVLFANMLPRAALSPLLLSIEEGMGVSHTLATRLFFFLSFGSAISMFFSGVISSRLKHRHTIVLSALAGGMSLLLASYAPSFISLAIGLAVFGLANGLFTPSGMATITSLVRPQEWGKAIALNEVGPNLTMIVAPVLIGLLASTTTWRFALRVMAVVELLMGAVFLFYGKGGDFRGSSPRLSNLRLLFRQPTFWILALLLSAVLGATGGVFSILPTFLVTERGMDIREASSLVGVSRLTVLVSVFASGWVIDRLGAKRSMLIFLLGTGIFTAALGLTSGVPLIIVAFLQPALGASFFPAALSVVSTLAPDNSRNLVYSATFPMVVLIGGGIVPSVLGLMGDRLTFSLGIVILGFLVLVLTPLVRLVKE